MLIMQKTEQFVMSSIHQKRGSSGKKKWEIYLSTLNKPMLSSPVPSAIRFSTTTFLIGGSNGWPIWGPPPDVAISKNNNIWYRYPRRKCLEFTWVQNFYYDNSLEFSFTNLSYLKIFSSVKVRSNKFLWNIDSSVAHWNLIIAHQGTCYWLVRYTNHKTLTSS